MFVEKKRLGIAPRLLTANGTTGGLLTLTTTEDLFVKQKIKLFSDNVPVVTLEVKRVISPTQFYVGEPGNIKGRYDASAFLTVDNATITADEQDRPGITLQDHERAVYAEEPIVAKRTIAVDKFGRYYSVDNPIPVQLSDGSVNIGTVEAQLEVFLTHKDDYPNAGEEHDSVRIGDGQDEMEVNTDGSINVNIVQSGADALDGLSHEYGEALAVVAAIETTVLTVSVPGIQKRIQKIEASGTNVAEFMVKIDSVIVEKKRIWHGDFNVTFDFEQFINGIKLLNGQILTVTVLHNRPMAGDFNATAWYL